VILGSTRQDLTLGFEYVEYGLLLRFVLPRISQQALPLRVVLPYPLETSLDEALDVIGIEG
jgi:hypothetical protein